MRRDIERILTGWVADGPDNLVVQVDIADECLGRDGVLEVVRIALGNIPEYGFAPCIGPRHF